jgi:hypothetical protein
VADDGRLDLLVSGTFGTETIEQPSLPSETRPSVSAITEGIGFLRSQTRSLHDDVGSLHRESQFAEWRNRTNQRARSSVQEMLNELADLGFAWRDLARLVGVSVPAIQKWRRGEGTTGENRRKVASLLAACDMITEHYGIQEVASWLEMPLQEDVPVTPLDLWVAERVDLVFDFASGHVDSEELLTSWDNNWHEKYHSDFEVSEAGDGQLAIRRRDT